MNPKIHFIEGILKHVRPTGKLDTICGREVDRSRVEQLPASLASLRFKTLDKYCMICHEIRWLQFTRG